MGEIRSRRKQAGLTQSQLAAASGVSQSLIAKIESGKVKPAYENVKRIIEALDSVEKTDKATASEIMTKRLASIGKADTVGKAIDMMRRSGYSQLPVLERGYPIGAISERTMVDIISGGRDVSDVLKKRVGDVMDDALPTVRENEPLESVSMLLKANSAVLVTKGGKAVGIITKADLFKIVKRK
jgi:predicted transcriptional regulator